MGVGCESCHPINILTVGSSLASSSYLESSQQMLLRWVTVMSIHAGEGGGAEACVITGGMDRLHCHHRHDQASSSKDGVPRGAEGGRVCRSHLNSMLVSLLLCPCRRGGCVTVISSVRPFSCNANCPPCMTCSPKIGRAVIMATVMRHPPP